MPSHVACIPIAHGVRAIGRGVSGHTCGVHPVTRPTFVSRLRMNAPSSGLEPAGRGFLDLWWDSWSSRLSSDERDVVDKTSVSAFARRAAGSVAEHWRTTLLVAALALLLMSLVLDIASQLRSAPGSIQDQRSYGPKAAPYKARLVPSESRDEFDLRPAGTSITYSPISTANSIRPRTPLSVRRQRRVAGSGRMRQPEGVS